MKHALIDCDGVLADFTGHLLNLVGASIKPSDVQTWNVFSYLTEKQKQAAKMLLASRTFWCEQPVISGAKSAVRAIRGDGYHVTCVTSPWYPCYGWGYLRREWLWEHFGIGKDDVCVFDQKQLLRGDIFIDDKPEHLTAWQHANPTGLAFCYDASYNRTDSDPSFDWPRRVNWTRRDEGLLDVRALLEQAAAAQSAV